MHKARFNPTEAAILLENFPDDTCTTDESDYDNDDHYPFTEDDLHGTASVLDKAQSHLNERVNSVPSSTHSVDTCAVTQTLPQPFNAATPRMAASATTDTQLP